MHSDIYCFLAGLGFKETEVPEFNHARNFFRRFKGPTAYCESNDKKPDILVSVFPGISYPNGLTTKDSVQMGIFGCVDGVWFKADPYGITFKYFIENYQRLENALVASWEAFAKEIRKEGCCPDCGVPSGEYHSDGCDVERCFACGQQAIGCDCDGVEDKLPWTGEWPGVKECRELGLYCRDLSPDGVPYTEENKMTFADIQGGRVRFHVPCEVTDEGAHEDLNRLMALSKSEKKGGPIETGPLKKQSNVVDMEIHRPHMVIELEGEVHVIPRAFFRDVIAGKTKIEDCDQWRPILSKILDEWLLFVEAQKIL